MSTESALAAELSAAVTEGGLAEIDEGLLRGRLRQAAPEASPGVVDAVLDLTADAGLVSALAEGRRSEAANRAVLWRNRALATWAEAVADAALRVCAAAFGEPLAIREIDLAATQEMVERWVDKATREPWPILVVHPLQELLRALNDDRPAAAYLFLRDTAEGVARVIWAVLAWEVLTLSHRARFSELTERERDACAAVLQSLRSGAFTFGAATHLLVHGGGPQVLDTLSGRLGGVGAGLTARLEPLRRKRKRQPGFVEPLDELRRWRNQDPGHGYVGDQTRLRRLFSAAELANERGPLFNLQQLFRALESWLPLAQAELARLRPQGWPDLEGSVVASSSELTDAPAPVAFVGDGAPLWLLDHALRDGLSLRDPVGGKLRRLTRSAPELNWAGVALETTWRIEPLRLYSDQQDQLQAHHDRRHRERRHKGGTLRALVWRSISSAAGTWVVVTGRGGTGKSFLVLDITENLRSDPYAARGQLPPGNPAGGRPWRVLMVRCMPALPLTRHHLAGALDKALADLRGEGQRVAVVEAGDRRLDLAEAHGRPGQAAEWWRKLVAANGNEVQLLIVFDGLDELPDEEGLLEVLPPPGLDGCQVILSCRSLERLHRNLRATVEGASRAEGRVDLDAFYATEQGKQELRRYLKRNHPLIASKLARPIDTQAIAAEDPILAGRLSAVGNPTLADCVTEKAERVFLHVFHLARGLEEGFVEDEPVGPGGWPRGSEFYGRYLTWLEQRVGHHPDYCRTLRAILFTYAECGLPINDRTLLALLHDGPSGLDSTEARLATEYVLPILRDLDDFIVRYRVDPYAASGTDLQAAWIAQPDVENGLSSASWVRALAHTSLFEFLAGDGVLLPSAWRQTRDEVRTHLARRVERLLLDERESSRQSSPVRYAQQRWPHHLSRAQVDVQRFHRVAEASLENVPSGLFLTRWVGHWVSSLEATIQAIRKLGSGEDRGRRLLGLLLSRYGQALAVAEETGRAIKVQEEAVVLFRTTSGLPENAEEESVTQSIRENEEHVRNLARGLDELGRVVMVAGDAHRAAMLHREEVRLKRALSNLPEGADEQAITQAVARDRRSVDELIGGLNSLGEAMRKAGMSASEMIDILREAVSLGRALERHCPSTGDWVGANLCLTSSLTCLSRALAVTSQWREAVQVARRAVVKCRLFAAPPPPPPPGYEATGKRDWDRTYFLLTSLDSLGDVLRMAIETNADFPQSSADASPFEVRQEQVRLLRELCDLPEKASHDSVQEAVFKFKGPVRDLARALLKLSWMLLLPEKIEVGRDAVRLFREVCGLSEGASGDATSRAALRSKGAVLELHAGLLHLGDALWRVEGRDREIVRVHEDTVRLARALCNLPENADDAAVVNAIHRDGNGVRRLSVDLGSLARALGRAKDVQGAAKAWKERVRLSRALCGLAAGAGVEDFAAAIRRDGGAVVSFAIDLRALGHSLLEAEDASASVTVFQEMVGLRRALCGVPAYAKDDAVATAIPGDRKAVGWLALALVELGRALVDATEAEKGVATHEEAIRLYRALCGLSHNADDQTVTRAIRRDKGDVGELAFGLCWLGHGLLATEDAEGAVDAGEEAVRLYRASLHKDGDQFELRWGLLRLRDAYMDAGNETGALAAHREAEELLRASRDEPGEA